MQKISTKSLFQDWHVVDRADKQGDILMFGPELSNTSESDDTQNEPSLGSTEQASVATSIHELPTDISVGPGYKPFSLESFDFPRQGWIRLTC